MWMHAVSYAWIHSQLAIISCDQQVSIRETLCNIHLLWTFHSPSHQRSPTEETLQPERTAWTLHGYRHGDRKGEVCQGWTFQLASYDNSIHSQTFLWTDMDDLRILFIITQINLAAKAAVKKVTGGNVKRTVDWTSALWLWRAHWGEWAFQMMDKPQGHQPYEQEITIIEEKLNSYVGTTWNQMKKMKKLRTLIMNSRKWLKMMASKKRKK